MFIKHVYTLGPMVSKTDMGPVLWSCGLMKEQSKPDRSPAGVLVLVKWQDHEEGITI